MWEKGHDIILAGTVTLNMALVFTRRYRRLSAFFDTNSELYAYALVHDTNGNNVCWNLVSQEML